MALGLGPHTQQHKVKEFACEAKKTNSTGL